MAGSKVVQRVSRWVAATLAAALTATVAWTVIAPGGPGGGPSGPDTALVSALVPFRDCAEMRRALREATRRPAAGYQAPAAEVGPAGTGAAAAAAAGSGAGALPATGPGGTGTNVQEQGVDEPDVAKAVGRFVFTVSGGTLHVVDTRDGGDAATGTLDLHAPSYPRVPVTHELLVVGDRVLVTAQDPTAGTTRLVLVDVADRTHPRLLQTAVVTGSYVTAREHAGLVRLVLASQPRIVVGPPLPPAQPRRPAPGPEQVDPQAAGSPAVGHAAAGTRLPHVVVRAADGTVLRHGALLDCAAVRHPETTPAPSLVTVVTVDPSAGLRRLPSRAVTAAGDLVYASASRLYVATATPVVPPLPAAPGRAVATPRTQVHAFDISRPGPARYVASGSVEGWLLDRWAMSEHEGLLRVASTRERLPAGTGGDRTASFLPRAPAVDSAVTVLAERGGRLVPVGQVGGLGRGESIRAVRWFGDLATVVTFRQTDPVYTVDLSDPRAPRVRGELEVPGYSAYLHPLGNGLLLGVGQEGDLAGSLGGLAVSAFDLSDVTRPRRADVAVLEATWSPVLTDSRAFTYLPERRLAVVPGEASTSPVPGTGGGAVVLAVGRDGSLREIATLARGVPVLRVLPAGGVLTAVGDDVVALFDADTLTETGQVRLR